MLKFSSLNSQIIIHSVVFILSLLFYVAIYSAVRITGPNGSPWPTKNIPLNLFAWAVKIYPVIIILGWILAKKISPNFLVLPLLNLIILLVLFTYFALQFVKNRSEDNKSLSQVQSSYSSEMQSASKDFLCSDGSFFSLAPISEPVSDYQKNLSHTVRYYSTSNPSSYVSAGGINKDGHSQIRINSGNSKESASDIKQKLSLCKNQSGQTLFDVYPE